MLLVNEDREYLLEPGERLETDLGVLIVPQDISPGETVTTHLDVGFTARRLRGRDFFEHFDRTGAPMMPRDIGLVLGETGIGVDDRVLDAGTGTGVLAAYCAHAGADVLTVESDADAAATARENFGRAALADAVELREGDLAAVIEELAGPFDAVTLDLPGAAAILRKTPRVLAPGATVIVYSPFVEAARDAHQAAEDCSFTAIETTETIQRGMDFDDRGSRPSTKGVGHTGYLTRARWETGG